MIFSTLPDIPSKKFVPVGVVYCCSDLNDFGLEQAFGKIQQQANAMNADAVVDIRITSNGAGHAVAIIGTAVRFI